MHEHVEIAMRLGSYLIKELNNLLCEMFNLQLRKFNIVAIEFFPRRWHFLEDQSRKDVYVTFGIRRGEVAISKLCCTPALGPNTAVGDCSWSIQKLGWQRKQRPISNFNSTVSPLDHRCNSKHASP